MFRMAIRALAACAVIGSGACGGTSGDDLDEEHATLVLEPRASEHLILNGVLPQQPFTAKLVDPAGHERDVTADTRFSIEPTFGTFTGATLSISAAGKSQAYGVWNDKTGTAQVLARLESVRVDPSLPPDTPDLFNAPEDPARAPTIAYPADGVVMPRNLGDFEVHWTDPHGNDVFEISLRTEFANVRVYVPGNNGLPAAGPRPSWTAFAATEWLAAVGTEPGVQYQVRGVNAADPTSVGATPPRLITLSNELMEGGLYYWAAGGQLAYGIYRHDMSKPGQAAEEYMTTNQTSGRCVACHVVSRDGTKMTITYDGGDGAATTVDVANNTRATSAGNWNFATYSPDGTRLLTVFRGALVVRNADDQSVIGTMPAEGAISHPDLSPDGTRLVYARNVGGGNDWSFASGALFTRSYDSITHAFGPELPLVADGQNNFYPSWSPDGEWILFNKSGAGTSYNNTNASLWAIKSDGTAPAIELRAANYNAGLTNSWGRWAPFEQSVGASSEKIYWITVSSQRDFGVRRLNSLDSAGLRTPQIWMMPFYPARALANQDPSVPAFRLPFQNLETNNHIAQWAERIVRPL
ncbi:MAG: TolB family protein [Kofleriaceae bacterium]